jgi:hypothetical protein
LKPSTNLAGRLSHHPNTKDFAMSKAMHDYLHDESGRRLTRAERLERLNSRFADQTIKTAAPDGTLAERQRQRHETALLQQEIAAQVAEQAAASKPKGNPWAARVAELQTQLEWAIPSERGGIERRLTLFRQEAAKWEAERATAERRATFEASPDFQRVKTHYEAFTKTRELVHPDLTDADVLMLAAIATSDAYNSPAAQASAYFEQVTKCETLQASREAERLATAEQVAAKAATEFAAQKARTDAANQRLAELGGDNAN